MAGQESDTVAVVVFRENGAWQSGVLPERVGGDLDGLIQVLRQQPAENGAIGLVNVADEFFVALRVRGDEVRMMLSDVTAAVAWDLARQVVDRLGIEAPRDDDLDDVWPAGDVGIFADLGLDEMELAALLSDLDAYADEMLVSVAGRLGFADVYDRALEAQPR
jgi:putative tRNA adenosine deaminase-associated protein